MKLVLESNANEVDNTSKASLSDVNLDENLLIDIDQAFEETKGHCSGFKTITENGKS